MIHGPAPSAPSIRAFVGLGTNLGDRLTTMRSAVRALDDPPTTLVVAASRIYETRPVGPAVELFLNAAVALDTSLGCRSLLERLHAIESAHGRTRRTRWESRQLDLDLLACVDLATGLLLREDTEGVTVPHPSAHLRDFVLQPLVDIGADLELHEGRTPTLWLSRLDAEARTILGTVDDPLWDPRT
jgi:2-amino-4-hydroxy-6-hydroxymethyldihydropteridine diphosphokinase